MSLSAGVFRIVASRGGIMVPVHEFVATPAIPKHELDIGILLARKWQIFPSELTVKQYCGEPRLKYIMSREFWTCDCEMDFIHHVSEPFCEKCWAHLECWNKTAWFLDEILTW